MAPAATQGPLARGGPPIRAYRVSNALRWPVMGPGGRVFLSTGQRTLLSVLRASRRRRATLDELTAWSGGVSRGRTADRLARLRELGLIGYSAQRGRLGCTRWWFGRLRRGIATAIRRARQGALNDSVPPSGGYVSLRAYARRSPVDLGIRGHPPGAGRTRAGVGPRRGRPPRILYGHCPAGHSTRIGRWSWMTSVGRLEATYRGRCRRCSAALVETLSLELPTLEQERQRRRPEAIGSLLERYLGGHAAVSVNVPAMPWLGGRSEPEGRPLSPLPRDQDH